MVDFLEQLTSSRVQNLLFPFKLLFALFSLAGVVFLIFVHHNTRWLRARPLRDLFEFYSLKPYEEKEFEQNWKKIKKRLERKWESESKLAIIESDRILDNLLKQMGYRGETLGERLKQLKPDLLPNIEEVWVAHKIRNDIIHDPNYRLPHQEAERAVEIYEKAFDYLRNA